MRALLLSVVTVLLAAAYSSVAQRDSTVPPYVKLNAPSRSLQIMLILLTSMQS